MADRPADSAPAPATPAGRTVVYEAIYDRLFHDLIAGQLEPGRALTVRGLAKRLEVSPMPVREAVKRLVAQGALVITETRRISVAPMSAERFEEIILGRTLLEPELAVLALPRFDRQALAELQHWDEAVDRAIESGDPAAYARANWEFHACIYARAERPILFGLVESLWLQVGPFMRQIAGRAGTGALEDQHHLAIRAIETGDEALLCRAIRQDILDGQQLAQGAQD
jgi:DNA-binding GntR family transcriptional regulator